MELKAGEYQILTYPYEFVSFACSVPREIFEITLCKLSFKVNQHCSTELSVTEA